MIYFVIFELRLHISHQAWFYVLHAIFLINIQLFIISCFLISFQPEWTIAIMTHVSTWHASWKHKPSILVWYLDINFSCYQTLQIFKLTPNKHQDIWPWCSVVVFSEFNVFMTQSVFSNCTVLLYTPFSHKHIQKWILNINTCIKLFAKFKTNSLRST